MKCIKLTFSLLLLLTIAMGNAQDSNIFLDRAYWKTNPSIKSIEQNITEGHDISALSSSYFDAVSWALIEQVDNRTIKYLLSKKGNDVNKKTHDGRTYVFWAAYKNNLEMMQYLINKGAKMNVIDSHGYSVLNFAAVTGQLNPKLYDLCIANGSNPVTETNHDGANALLLVAPFLQNETLIDYFTSKGISINSTDANGNGLFNYATKNGNIELLKTLVNKGVETNVITKNGGNAMIFASQGTRRHTNSLEVFKYLESIGVTPNITTNSGTTPLHALAYKCKDLKVFDYFISKGVAINQADKEGNTALLNAAYNNDLAVIKHLIKLTDNINVANNEGKTALTNAIYRNTVDVVDLLIKNGADITVKDKNGNTLAYYLLKAYRSKSPEIFNKKLAILTKNGLNIKATQANGNTLFHVALNNSNLNLLKRVHDLGIDVNQKNDEGISPLHIAAMKAKDQSILKYLINIGADKTIKTDFNESVYDLAKENELLQLNTINIEFLK